MAEHESHEMHENSLEAHAEESASGKFSKRAQSILEVYERRMFSLTDREIMKALGFVDKNAVSPRITELIDKGIVEECGSITCPITGKTVRITRRKAYQARLF